MEKPQRKERPQKENKSERFEKKSVEKKTSSPSPAPIAENKEEKQSEIDKILSQYDIEKKSLEEISMFFKTEVENNSIAVNNK